MNRRWWIVAIVATGWATLSSADSTNARCDIYAAGEGHTNNMIPCTFSQLQGYVTITRADD